MRTFTTHLLKLTNNLVKLCPVSQFFLQFTLYRGELSFHLCFLLLQDSYFLTYLSSPPVEISYGLAEVCHLCGVE